MYSMTAHVVVSLALCYSVPGALGQSLLSPPATTTTTPTPTTAVEATPTAPAAPSERDIALACASTRYLLEQYQAEKDPANQTDLLTRANQRIRSLVSDPRVESLDAWRLAGVIAAQNKDAELAAFAFEAIRRLKPGFATDTPLLKIMAALDAFVSREQLQLTQMDIQFVLNNIAQAEQGDMDAMFHLGVRYDCFGMTVCRGSVLGDQARAVEWYTSAAKAGHPNAMYNLGVKYAEGKGVRKNVTTAVEWFNRAAKAGGFTGGSAVVHVSEFTFGRGVNRDEPIAAEWYSKAALAGDSTAMFCLGEMYENGRGVPEDFTNSVMWKLRAAESGCVRAMLDVYILYSIGAHGFPENKIEAVEWRSRAASAGDLASMYWLGCVYYNGDSVTKDEAKGIEWWIKAARAGVGEAKDILRERGINW